MRSSAFCLLILAGTVSLGAQAPPATPDAPSGASAGPFASIVEARPVRFEKPVTFWRDGKETSTTAAILLRVKVSDPLFFLPRSIRDPLFVYGNAVCEVLQSPLTGEAILLAPQVSAKEPSVLWLTPAMGLHPRQIDQAVVQRYRPKSADVKRGRGLTIKEPKVKLGERVYEDVEELKREIREVPGQAVKQDG
jgi:hypothetical protein